MKFPKIGIVTPSFNQGEFINKTINSVLSQNYPNLEYWVIDGGSRDNTISILKKYGEKINWISKKDKGQAQAINKGLKKIKADIFAYINSDDVFTGGTFEKVADVFLKKKANWVTGSYEIIDENDQKISSQAIVKNYKDFLLSHYSNFLLKSANSIIPQPSTFWSSEVLNKIGYFNENLKYTMDYDYWLRISKYYKLTYIPEVLSQFRIHKNSKSMKFYKQQFAEEKEVLKNFGASNLEQMIHMIHTNLTIFAYSNIK